MRELSEIKLGLESIKELLRVNDNPEREQKIIHIAGTNGKGSVLAFLEEILVTAGYKVGKFVSPAVFDDMEIIQYRDTKTGKNIPRSDYDRIKDKILDSIGEMNPDIRRPTDFEIDTAVAFVYFGEIKPDFILLEVGMGGRLDSTNVVKNPLMTIITPVSLDHTGFLGDTVEKIAYNKAGIIKKDSPLVTYQPFAEAEKVIIDEYRAINTKLPVVVNEEDISIESMTLDGTFFCYKGEDYKIKALGKYQVYNACIAIEAAREFADLHDIKVGLENMIWPGRFQKIQDNPLVIVDGAHNISAVRMLHETVRTYFSGKLVGVMGVFADKDYREMLDIMEEDFDALVTVTPPMPRGLDAEKLKAEIERENLEVFAFQSVKEGFEYAKKLAGRDGSVLVFGSLSNLKEVCDDKSGDI